MNNKTLDERRERKRRGERRREAKAKVKEGAEGYR